MNARQLAQRFHEIYERLAPSFGYETRKESAKPWTDVPERNRNLMIAVCQEILGTTSEGAPACDWPKMTIGQRFETLTARATRQISEARRKEIQRKGQAMLDELILRQGVDNTEELFYLLAFDAFCAMANYAEEQQAEIGAEILRQALEED